LILTALGTDEHPFERALDVIDRLRPEHELVVQHGHTPARDWAEARWFDFVPFETLMSLMREAEAIVCHGGVGTIMTTLLLGRRPMVIPRLAAYGEHVDDHQLQIVANLASRGFVVPLLDGADIEAAIDDLRGSVVEWDRNSKLFGAVVAAADGVG
jgi:UDP-N-acetylglucosamine transferase subunit ALG13